MFKYFVEAKLITAGDFDACWPAPSLTTPPTKTVEPFIHNLAERQLMPVDKSLKSWPTVRAWLTSRWNATSWTLSWCARPRAKFASAGAWRLLTR
jgi:hypothetical protein